MNGPIQPRLFEAETVAGYVSPYRDGLPGHHGRHTEKVAAIQALGEAGKTTRRVWEFLERRGDEGGTYTEVQQALGIDSAQQRLSDLVRRGLVVDSGRRRLTPRKRAAIVWVVATKARLPQIRGGQAQRVKKEGSE